MEIKLEGRQVDLGNELQERIKKRLDSLDRRFGPITHARVTVEKRPHNNEQRAEAKAIINIAGSTITVAKEAATVVAAVNETLDILTENLKGHVEKKKKDHR
ncbi:MAG: ribosome-associated translation inhibitor RaiA [Magnetococcales bacterium]|nr:ribosome-associated translation inhibitor RaiA [Magnetococcales bacterium]